MDHFTVNVADLCAEYHQNIYVMHRQDRCRTQIFVFLVRVTRLHSQIASSGTLLGHLANFVDPDLVPGVALCAQSSFRSSGLER